MNTTRNGKIARLPRTLRDELSQRIDNGQSGPKLADWLNQLPEVKTILAEYFAENPIINVQNISQWRKGGYQEWHDLQEIRQTTRELATDASLLDNEITPQKISETYATVTAADFVRTSRAKLKACQDIDQRWKCLDEVEKRLSRFRRDDHRASHASIRASQASLRRERWTAQEEDRKTAADQAAETEQRRHMLTYFDLQPELLKLGQQNCGNEKGYDRAVFILELRHNLPIGFLDEKPPTLYPPNPEGRVPSEGRVPVPIIGRVPNTTPAPEPPTAPTPASDTADNSRNTQYEIRPSIKPKTPSEMAEIKPNQSPYERTNSPQNEPPTRPTCQPIPPSTANQT